jgi:hypothetical protein
MRDERWMRALALATGRPLVGSAADVSADPTIRAYQNARERALALGVPRPQGEADTGWLGKIMMPLEFMRAGVYAGSTELGDLLTGRGWDWEDYQGKFERGVREGEGFGSTEALRVSDGASLPERVVKMGAAFALDVGLDPLNYATLGTGTLPKIAVGSIAKGASKKALKEVTEAAAKQAVSEGAEGVSTRLAQRQMRFAGSVPEAAVATQAKDLSSEAVEQLAADRLADVIGTARTIGTGRTVTAALRQELADLGFKNADELALSVTRNLPRELRGGLGLEVPFTRIGTSLTRGAGAGTDAIGLGKAADAINTARLAARAGMRSPSSPVSKLGGETSEAYGRLLREVRSAGEGTTVEKLGRVLNTPGATTALDVAELAATNSAKRTARNKFIAVAERSVIASRRALDDFGDQQSGEAIIKASFHDFGLDDALRGLDPNAPEVKRLIDAGAQIREVFEEASSMRGFKPDPDRKYVPFIFTEEELVRRQATAGPRTRNVGQANPLESRYAYEDLVPLLDDNDELVELLGRRLSAPEINKLSGRQVVVEDPFVILRERVARDGAAIEAKVVADRLAKAGIIQKTPLTATRTSGQVKAEVNKATKAAVKTSSKAAEGEPQRLADAQSLLAVTKADEAAARTVAAGAKAQARTEAARTAKAVADAEAAATAARAEVRAAERALKRVAARDDIAAKKRAQGRLSRANAKQADTTKQLNNAKRRLRAAEKKAETFSAEVREEYVALSKQLRAARKRAETAAERSAAAPDDAALQRKVAVAARKVEELEQQVQEFLVRTDGAAAYREMAGKVAGQRAAVDDLTSRQARLTGTIDELTSDISVLDQRIANADPEQLRNLLAALDDDGVAAVRRAAAAAQDLDAKNAVVADLKAKKARLMDEIRRNTPAENQTKLNRQQAEKLEADVRAQIAARKAADDQLVEELDKINAVVATGDWQQASQMFASLVKKYRAGGAPDETIKQLNKARKETKKLGAILDQENRLLSLRNEGGLRSLVSDTDSPMPRSLEGFLAGEGVAQSLRTIFQQMESPSGLRKLLGPYLNPYMRFFKTWATLGRGPGYHVRNFVGGMVNNWLLGVRREALAPAGRISRTISKTLDSISEDVSAGRLTPRAAEAEFHKRLKAELSWQVDYADRSAYDLARGFLEEGVQYSRTNELLEREAAERLARAAGKKGTGPASLLVDNWWLQKNAFWAEEAERYMRLGAYIEGVARYGDQNAAGMFAKAGHFDYQDLTQAEQALKFVVPFYTWTRYNIPFQFRQAINNPGSVNRLDAFATNFQMAFGDPDSDGLVPDWMRDRMGFETPWTLPGGAKLGFMVESPQLDLFELFGSDGLNPIDNQRLLDNLNPVVRGGFELAQGRTTYGADANLFTSARGLVPPASQAMRQLGVTEKDRERAFGSWLSFAGVPAASITEPGKRGEARVRTGRISQQVQEALAPFLSEGEEIDTRWLTTMAQEGRTPEQILAAVKAGYGRKGGPKMPERNNRWEEAFRTATGR